MSEETPARPESTITFPLIPIFLVVVLVVGAVAYSLHERSVAKKLAADNNVMSATLNATRDQVNTLSAKMSELETKSAQEPATKPAAMVFHKPLTAAVARHRMRRVEDPRWKKMQGQLDEQGRQIDATRQDLTSTRTELQGSIAKTHDDLVLLEKKGERNYYEFDVDKTKQFRAAGPVGIKLKKANTKHQYADLQLMVDDNQLDKKHVNLYEPVIFLNTDSGQPVQLVIQSITKNHIHGYVSEPKYRAQDLASTSAPQPERKKLSIPQE